MHCNRPCLPIRSALLTGVDRVDTDSESIYGPFRSTVVKQLQLRKGLLLISTRSGRLMESICTSRAIAVAVQTSGAWLLMRPQVWLPDVRKPWLQSARIRQYCISPFHAMDSSLTRRKQRSEISAACRLILFVEVSVNRCRSPRVRCRYGFLSHRLTASG